MIDFLLFLGERRTELGRLVAEHLAMSGFATLVATLIGLPLGILLTRKKALAGPVLAVANVVQTIPSLALFGLLIPLPLIGGIGPRPAILALIVYAVLPILRNTYDGIRGVDPTLREAALALGLTPFDRLRLIELPLALPVILGGVRLAAVWSIGTATIAAAVGAGGLGTYVFRGIATVDSNLVLAGALPAALLAVVVDLALGRLAQTARPLRAVTALVVAALAGAFTLVDIRSATPRVVVGSKNFTESVLLGEIVAATLERRGLEVERRFNLGGAWLCHRALLSESLDVYVEYTGTALMDIFKRPKETDRTLVLAALKADYARFGIAVLSPLGYENNFALVVRKSDSERLGLGRISDLVKVSDRFRLGMFGEFLEREDGFPALTSTYRLKFAQAPIEMDLGLLYQALENNQIDLAVGSTTDGLIAAKGFVVLEDDQRYFPPYDAIPIVREEALARHPGLRDALESLGGRLDADTMRRLNYEVDGRKRDPREVAREFVDLRRSELETQPHAGETRSADRGHSAATNLIARVQNVFHRGERLDVAADRAGGEGIHHKQTIQGEQVLVVVKRGACSPPLHRDGERRPMGVAGLKRELMPGDLRKKEPLERRVHGKARHPRIDKEITQGHRERFEQTRLRFEFETTRPGAPQIAPFAGDEGGSRRESDIRHGA